MVKQVVIHPVYEELGSDKLCQHTIKIRLFFKDDRIECIYSKGDITERVFPVDFELPEKLTKCVEVLIEKSSPRCMGVEGKFFAVLPSKYPEEDVDTLNIRVYGNFDSKVVTLHMD